jgi:hypothetical protein
MTGQATPRRCHGDGPWCRPRTASSACRNLVRARDFSSASSPACSKTCAPGAAAAALGKPGWFTAGERAAMAAVQDNDLAAGPGVIEPLDQPRRGDRGGRQPLPPGVDRGVVQPAVAIEHAVTGQVDQQPDPSRSVRPAPTSPPPAQQHGGGTPAGGVQASRLLPRRPVSPKTRCPERRGKLRERPDQRELLGLQNLCWRPPRT